MRKLRDFSLTELACRVQFWRARVKGKRGGIPFQLYARIRRRTIFRDTW